MGNYHADSVVEFEDESDELDEDEDEVEEVKEIDA